MKIRNLLLLAVASLLMVSCADIKSVPYMTNIDEIPAAALSAATTQAGDFSIKPGDLLQINVAASNKDVVAPFNKVHYVPTAGMSYNIGDHSSYFYLVDDNGNIDFPVLGKLHIAGMTKNSLEDYVASLIYPRYLNERPGVECRIQNFKVFCLGEFKSPGVVQATNGRLNVVEAITMCGDLTLQGMRDNILLVRTDASGQRTVKRININDAAFLAMPEYNLQQNDILYVQPNKYKARTVWSMPPAYSAGVSIFSTIVSVVTFITVLARK